jgi:hypothetical protein
MHHAPCYMLQTTIHKSNPNYNYKLQIYKSIKLQTINYKLQTTTYNLQTTNYKLQLQTTNYKL